MLKGVCVALIKRIWESVVSFQRLESALVDLIQGNIRIKNTDFEMKNGTYPKHQLISQKSGKFFLNVALYGKKILGRKLLPLKDSTRTRSSNK